MTRAALYLRVSSDAQAEPEKYGLEAQEAACRAYAGRNDLEVVRVYRDVISGTKERREDFDRLLREAPAYGAVVVYAVDRLARSTPVAYTLLAALSGVGLTVHSALEGPLDLLDDNAALNFGIRAVLADAERRRSVARMYAGKLAKVRGGQTVKPLSTYGWRGGEHFEEQARWVRWVFEELEKRGALVVLEDLERLGVPTPSGRGRWGKTQLFKIVRNPLYRGLYEYGRKGERLRVEVAPIVTPQQWARTNEALSRRFKNSSRPGTRRETYPLLGHIRCRECGSTMSASAPQQRNGKPKHRYYFCRGTLKQHGAHCDHRTYYALEDLHEVARAGLRALVEDRAQLAAAFDRGRPPAPVHDWSAERERLKAELVRWKRAYAAEVIDLEEFAQEKERLERALAALPMSAARMMPAPDMGAWLARVGAALDAAELHELVEIANVTLFVAHGGAVTFAVRP